MQEKIVGFDAREMWVEYPGEWTLEFQKMFLLEREITKPLSVDTAIWHSVFDDNAVPRPEIASWRHRTWVSLPQLEAHLQTHSDAIAGKYWMIAITHFLDEATSAEIGIDFFPVEPDKIDSGWTFLGYDVAEITLLSGLMNMGYSIEKNERVIAQQAYREHLNEYHLFGNREVAMRFAGWSNIRDPGHGPFYVYGLYAARK